MTSTSTTTATSSSRRKGPPLPLNLQSRADSAPIFVASGPDSIEEHHPILADKPAMPPRGPGSFRNIKRLSLSVSTSNDVQTALPPAPMAQPSLPQPSTRRRSVVSLPAGASAASVLRRNDEGDDAPAAAYLDGPIEIMPGVWLGSEDNARDWKCLAQRGIKAILNVAKEIASPFEPSSIRNTTSTPNFNNLPRYAATLQPAHLPSGRPSMHYLKLAWSHGQADLVRTGFPEAMSFVDEALNRHQGVLIHCQCGVSRSATMVIALVMRAAALGGPNVQPDVLALGGKGMQGAYDFVQKKSKSIGPNMSLIYQLLDYERALKGGDSPGKSSIGASEDEEWGRRRQEVDSPDEESREIIKEAKELDRAMEERRERKLSLASNSSTGSFTGAVGNGAPWRVRYGSGVHNRSRAASIESNFTSVTSVSAFSDDPLEEEDENEDPTKATTPDTDATDDDAHCFGMPPHFAKLGGPKTTVPPSAPPTKTSFGLPLPSAPAHQQSFNMSSHASSSRCFTQPRSDASQRALPNLQNPSFKKEKRRPPPLKDMEPVVPFPSVQVELETTNHHVSSHRSSVSSASSDMISSTSSSRSRRLSARLSSFVPFPIRTALSGVFTSEASQPTATATVLPTPSATQTLFVFPPSPRARGASTPSTLTLVCTPLLTPSFSGIGNQTPRAGVFRKRTDSRKSWIGLSAVTPTTATARVDARGLFESQ